MNDDRTEETTPETPAAETTPDAPESRYPELDALQREVELLIRSNHRFLQRLKDDDFEAEKEDEEGDEGEEDFEEL